MTDEELEARLRRLAAAPEKDARFWDEMAADVRAAYAREAGRVASSHSHMRMRRRLAAPAAALALAAGLLLWQRLHHPPRGAAAASPTATATATTAPAEPPLSADEVSLFGSDSDETDELIDELDAAELDRVAQAFKKGA